MPVFLRRSLPVANQVIAKRYQACGQMEPIPMADFKEKLNQQNPMTASGTMRWNIDTSKSLGAKLVDSEGTEFLDAFMQISSIPLGYNNQELMDCIADPEVLKMIVSRSSMGLFPPKNLIDLLEKPLSIKPPGMDHIQTLMCGSCTIENAFKTAFGYQAYKNRGGEGPSELELNSCMDGLSPGSSSGVILGFRGCFHGRTFGSLSVTNSKSAIKVDMPAFEWPHAPFPQLKYPLHENVRENQIEEDRCLEQTEDLFLSWKKLDRPIAGVVIEPIQGEGGDRAATDSFYEKLAALCKKYDAVFIIDEVQTGFGATGKWWASEYWNTQGDILCYAKKSQACGFYYNKKFSHNPNTRIFNTWMGEPLKLVMMNKVIDIVQRDNLLNNVLTVGDFMHQGFLDLENQTQDLINSSRGRGLYRAFDVADIGIRDKIVAKAFENKLIIGPCGNNGIRFRPSLNFKMEEAERTVEILNQVIRDLS